MTEGIDRRTFAGAVTAFAALGFLPGAARSDAADTLALGESQRFSFARLQETAQDLAARPYFAQKRVAPEIIEQIDYDTWGKIHFRPQDGVFAEGPGRFPVTFFHLGRFFQKPVEMHLVEGDRSRRILYAPQAFDMPPDSAARQLPNDVGFAGLRFQEARDGAIDWRKNDWAAFLGASYFRAIGELHQYGLSARGIALDTAVADRDEEFPDFVRFYIGAQHDDAVTLHALLDGPGITGAYRFQMQRAKAVTMDIACSLFLRRDVSRLGIAPLTSMYWFSETSKPFAIDWRPEVHDSDGLAIWTGAGQRLWRPLNNPPHAMVSAFADENPKGFGLMQRDRNFDHYGDGVFYDRRPSLWVEPLGSWGKGSVQLIELATDDESHDNIVALWVPAEPARAGDRYDLNYRLHWLADEPYPSPLARCIATRLGSGGQPGQHRPKGVRKFLVEFEGGPLVDLSAGVAPQLDLWSSRGTFADFRLVEPVPDSKPGHWRVQFDLEVDGTEPVDIHCSLRSGGVAITETWMFQYHPF